MLVSLFTSVFRQYGKQLYINFQEAMRRTEAAYDWSSLSSSSIKSGSSSSSLPGVSASRTFLGADPPGLV